MTTTIEKDDDILISLLLLAEILNVVEHPAQDRQTNPLVDLTWQNRERTTAVRPAVLCLLPL